MTQPSERTAVPSARTSFYGRERELARLRDLVRSSSLVTVTGVGGAGKTRLAVEVTSGAGDDVRWCLLTAVARDEAVAPAVADALGRARDASPQEAVIATLQEHPRLLVLDNCEHVVAGAAELVERLLAECPDARVVATSREPLGLDGEQLLQLGPLALPERDDLESLAHSEAGALFVDRARAVRWDFELDHDDAEPVARICRRLDGLPLAIELAAARVRTLSPAEIAAHLDERFSLLTRPRSRGAERHRALRATIDWSYRLLEEPERLLFERLSVFVGGFNRPAATAVCSGAGVDPEDVLDLLDRLADKSLLHTELDLSKTRYGMLESLRHYARDRLAEHADEDRVRELHADHYAEVADRMRRDAERGWSRDMIHEGVALFGEVGAAVRFAIERDATHERAFRMLAPLWALVHTRHAIEIAALCNEALTRWPDVHDALGQAVLGSAAVAEFVSGQAEAAGAHARSAIAAEREDAPPAVIARRAVALVTYGFLGNARDGLERLDEVVQAAHAADVPAVALEMAVLRSQAVAALGDLPEALRQAEAARVEAERLDSEYMLAWALYILGTVLKADGDERARGCLEESLRLGRGGDFHLVIGSSLRQLGAIDASAGRSTDAARLLADAYEHFAATGDRSQRWDVLRSAAPLLARSGRRNLAARALAGAAADPRARRPAPLEAEALDRLRSELRAELRAAEVTPPRLEDVGPAVAGELRALAGAPPATAGSPAVTAAPPAEHSFRREGGELWRLTYDGASAHLPELKGLHDLARLLAAPDEEIHCLELVAGGAPSAERQGSHGLGVEGHAGELLDERGRADYKRRMDELRDEVELAQTANDPVRAEAAREELDALTRTLASAFGLGGRARTSADPAERARSAVTWRIRSALAKIEAAHPPLGKHLRNSVTTGTFCAYRPERPERWST